MGSVPNKYLSGTASSHFKKAILWFLIAGWSSDTP